MIRIPFMSRRVSGEDIPEVAEDIKDVPGWVNDFRRWGVPVAAILVLALCAPGEQHLGELAGFGERLGWGMAGLFTLYAGLASVISTQLPKGAKGKRSSVVGAFLSLLLAMAAQPVSHLLVTGYISTEPRPPLWLVVSVSSVPPLILGHLLHFAAMGAGQRPRPVTVTTPTPVATVTPIRPRPVPSPVPVPSVAPVSRPSVRPAAPVLSLTKGQPTGQNAGQTAGQNGPSLSARALELWLSGWDKDKIKDTLKTEFVSPDGTPPKANSLSVAIRRAEAKHPRP